MKRAWRNEKLQYQKPLVCYHATFRFCHGQDSLDSLLTNSCGIVVHRGSTSAFDPVNFLQHIACLHCENFAELKWIERLDAGEANRAGHEGIHSSHKKQLLILCK